MDPAAVNNWNWLSITKETVEIIFYVVAIIGVIVGLKGWKKELRGRARYEAAKNVIAGAYRVRDAINNARPMMMSSAEWADREQGADEVEPEKSVRNTLHAYAKRYEAVATAQSQWYPAVVEAEALFGEDARKKIKELYVSAQKLRLAIESYHRKEIRAARSYSIREEHKPDRFHQQCANIIFGTHPGLATTEEDRKSTFYDDDGFQQHLDSAVLGIKEHFEECMK